ncbi:MAG: hypothetical protein ACP5UT_03255 [Bryobacteraceae bacterium]
MMRMGGLELTEQAWKFNLCGMDSFLWSALQDAGICEPHTAHGSPEKGGGT